jgi:hypothetical protein
MHIASCITKDTKYFPIKQNCEQNIKIADIKSDAKCLKQVE